MAGASATVDHKVALRLKVRGKKQRDRRSLLTLWNLQTCCELLSFYFLFPKRTNPGIAELGYIFPTVKDNFVITFIIRNIMPVF